MMGLLGSKFLAMTTRRSGDGRERYLVALLIPLDWKLNGKFTAVGAARSVHQWRARRNNRYAEDPVFAM